jgi:hypothetical protein
MRLIIPLSVLRYKRDLELGIASAAYVNAGSQHQTHNRKKSKPQQQLKSREAQGDLCNETTKQGEHLDPGELLCPSCLGKNIPQVLSIIQMLGTHICQRQQCTGENSHSTTQKTQEAQTKRAPRGQNP